MNAATALLVFPCFAQPVKASLAGLGRSNSPVALLIGNSDLFARLFDWQQIWSNLVTEDKRMDLQLLIGGAGLENDLRWRCVWAGGGLISPFPPAP